MYNNNNKHELLTIMELLYSFKFGYGYVFEIKHILTKKSIWVLIMFDKITYMRHAYNFQQFTKTFNVKETNKLNECIVLKIIEMNDAKRWFEEETYLDMDKQILLFCGRIYDLTKCSQNDTQFILNHVYYDSMKNNVQWLYDN